MSLYIPKMSDTPAITIPGLADNFGLLAGSQIVEQGSNENGEYIRWENGLQICIHNITLPNSPDSTIWMTLTGVREWYFPSPYVHTPSVAAMVYGSYHESNLPNILESNKAVLGVASPLRVVVPYSARVYQTAAPELLLFAIGRWK